MFSNIIIEVQRTRNTNNHKQRNFHIKNDTMCALYCFGMFAVVRWMMARSFLLLFAVLKSADNKIRRISGYGKDSPQQNPHKMSLRMQRTYQDLCSNVYPRVSQIIHHI